ncbi:uncharacterized protein [Rutidosis leptorrhynchoides]|uniref:uncharacterized protein n=1 Tax=Rutidosis leptorrhynchoides TaxID=125765 RepID=UPI003A999C22
MIMLGAGHKKNKNEGRSRFSNEQIQFLECMFETQSRPDLKLKQQVADKLGLHPRQVAIWFQNRRARSKSRQTEQEYNNLKHNYDTLASKSESLKEENQALHTQLQVLKDLENTKEGNQDTNAGNSNKNINQEFDGSITLSTTNNSKVLSENYSHEFSVPFYYGTSNDGEDVRGFENEEHTGCLIGSDRSSWWEL